jgi:hypothetical protein
VGVLAMGGHEDGVIAFGTSASAAGEALLGYFAQALAREQDHPATGRASGSLAWIGPGLEGRC